VGVCRIVSCSLRNDRLSLIFDHKPSACVGHVAWKTEGLAVPSKEMHDDWHNMLDFLRAREKARFSQITEILQRLGLHTYIPAFM
jgi:hypothetical protein